MLYNYLNKPWITGKIQVNKAFISTLSITICQNNKMYACKFLNSLLIIYLHFLSNLMNHWQLLNNWFINNAILHLDMINESLIKYEHAIIKHIIDMILKPL